MPSLLLQLKNPAAEDEWNKEFKLQLKKHDLLATYMIGCTAVSVAIRSAHLKPRIYHYIVIEAIQNILLYSVQVVDGGSFFTKHRTAIIGTVRTLRLILNSYLLFLAGQEELAFPLLTTKHFSWNQYPVVSRLLIKSALPVLQSFGFRAPLYHHFWLTLSTLVTMSFFAIPRCNFECTGNPSLYPELYYSCLRYLSMLQRLVPGPVKVNLPDSLGCNEMCFVTNMFILSFVGFLVPTLILAAVEEPSRAFVLMRFGGTPFFHSTKTLLLFTLSVLPLVAALDFELISTATLLYKYFFP